MRWQRITTLGPRGVFGLFTAGVALVAGVSIFSSGATFNLWDIVATNHQVSANLADEVVMLVAPGDIPSWGDQVGIVAAPIWVLAASPGKNDTSDQPGLNG